jgi:hypothetical protein
MIAKSSLTEDRLISLGNRIDSIGHVMGKIIVVDFQDRRYRT